MDIIEECGTLDGEDLVSCLKPSRKNKAIKLFTSFSPKFLNGVKEKLTNLVDDNQMKYDQNKEKFEKITADLDKDFKEGADSLNKFGNEIEESWDNLTGKLKNLQGKIGRAHV